MITQDWEDAQARKEGGDGPVQISLTMKQASERTGLSPGTLYLLIASGKLQSSLIGRRRLILAKSLEKIITQGTVMDDPNESGRKAAPERLEPSRG
jgi:excisionase family DNA binding protein